MNDKKRSHDRAEGKAQTSISLDLDLLEAARIEARRNSRSLSNWIELLLKGKLEEIEKARESGDLTVN
jgi:hypothetical protein